MKQLSTGILMALMNYRKFYEESLADSLAEKLSAEGIVSEVVRTQQDLNFIYGDKQFKEEYIVNIDANDFEKADALMLRSTREEVLRADKSHYLFEFTDEELFDIVARKDEWNEFDYQLAQKILKDRGKEVSVSTVELLRKQRIAELTKPEESQPVWIWLGYFLAFMGGALGICMGYFLMTSKKTLPNGTRLYTYTKKDRTDGARIVIVGIICLILQTAYFIYTHPA